MIPLWLTPKIMKLGVIGIALLAVFWCGFYTKGKLVEAKILRLKNSYSVVTANYQACVEQNGRAVDALNNIRVVLDKQNAEVKALNDASVAAIERSKRLNRIAIENERRSHDVAMTGMMERYTSLNHQFMLLSESESCHLAWLEVTQ